MHDTIAPFEQRVSLIVDFPLVKIQWHGNRMVIKGGMLTRNTHARVRDV